MALPKFFVFLKTLKPGEVVGFFKYLKQTQGKDSIPVQIFDYYRHLYPDFSDEKKMDPDYARDKIFGKRKSGNGETQTPNFSNTFYDLNVLLKDFLIHEKIRTDEQLADLLWIYILHERNQQEQFSRQADALYQKTIAQTDIQCDDTLKNSASAIWQFRNLSQNVRSPDFEGMKECMYTLNTYLETIRYKMACLMANNRKLVPHGSEEEDFLRLPENQEGVQAILLNIYRDIYTMIRTEEEAVYSRIEAQVQEHIESIGADDLDGILGFLTNFTAARVRKSDPSIWNVRQHELNVLSLKRGIFMNNGYMSSTRFTNILDIACSAKKFEWADSFIQEYGPKLPEVVRQTTIDLGKAIPLFFKQKYREVLALLPKLQITSESRDINYIIRVRQMILRCYFEVREEPDIILNYCIALESTLLDIPKPRRESIDALLEFTRICKLILMRKIDEEGLIKRFADTPNVFAKDWLLKQALRYNK